MRGSIMSGDENSILYTVLQVRQKTKPLGTDVMRERKIVSTPTRLMGTTVLGFMNWATASDSETYIPLQGL